MSDTPTSVLGEANGGQLRQGDVALLYNIYDCGNITKKSISEGLEMKLTL